MNEAAPGAQQPLLGEAGVWVIGVYLIILLGIGIASRLARRENSLSDFFLGGRALG